MLCAWQRFDPDVNFMLVRLGVFIQTAASRLDSIFCNPGLSDTE